MEILKAIKRTIEYSQKYGRSLNEEELFERLISKKVYSREEFNKIKEQTLRPAGTSLDRETFLEEKINKAEELAKKIEKEFGDILFLGITGSVAAGNPKKNSDIDLMIIMKANTLWINRLKLRWFVMRNKIPHRKPKVKEKINEFCFNLWLDEKSLKLKKERQNLKNAMDLIMMKPLINKNKTYEKFIFVNDWAKEFVATGYSLKPTLPSLENGGLKNIIFFDKVINWVVFWPQFLYMKKKMKGEQVGLHEAFFHR